MNSLSTIACLTCAKAFADHGDGDAAGWAILFMLGLLVPVLGTALFVIIRLVRKSETELEDEFRDEAPVDSALNS